MEPLDVPGVSGYWAPEPRHYSPNHRGLSPAFATWKRTIWVSKVTMQDLAGPYVVAVILLLLSLDHILEILEKVCVSTLRRVAHVLDEYSRLFGKARSGREQSDAIDFRS